MPKISIIVPVYKKEYSLAYCIDSILSQSFTDFELILVDDGSPDNCGKMCDEYALKDNRIKVIHIANGGVSNARNVGIEKANGKYITFVDADDKLYQDALKVMLEGLENASADLTIGDDESETVDYNNNTICFSRAYKIDQMTVKREDLSTCAEFLWLYGGMIGSCAKLYKLDIIKRRNIRFNTNLIVLEDADFVIKYVRECNIIHRVSDIVYIVCDYVGRNSEIHRSRSDYMDDVVYVYNEIKEFFKQIGVQNENASLNVVNGTFSQAWVSLLCAPVHSAEQKRTKYKRLKEVLSYPMIQKIIEERKANYLAIEYLCLRMRSIRGLRFINFLKKKMRKHTKNMMRSNGLL